MSPSPNAAIQHSVEYKSRTWELYPWWIGEGDQTFKSHRTSADFTVSPLITSSQESKAAWSPEIYTECGQNEHQEKTSLSRLWSGKGQSDWRKSPGSLLLIFSSLPLQPLRNPLVVGTSSDIVTAGAVGRHLQLSEGWTCGPKSVKWIRIAVRSLALSPPILWPWTQAWEAHGTTWREILEKKKYGWHCREDGKQESDLPKLGMNLSTPPSWAGA